jgi:subtilisin family serine protease
MVKDEVNKHYFMPGEFIVMVVYKPEDMAEIVDTEIDEMAAKVDADLEKMAAEINAEQIAKEKSIRKTARKATKQFLSELWAIYKELKDKEECDFDLHPLADMVAASIPGSFPYPSAENNMMVSITKLAIESDDEPELIKNVIDWMRFFAIHYYNEEITNVITPNWFSIPAQSPSIDGGPGGKPIRPAKANPTWLPFVGDVINAIGTPDESCLVDVFVLDTIPDCKRIDWATNNLGSHGVWQRVWAQSLSKRAPYASKKLVPWLDDLQGPKHDYEMPDHGLFIAGTIAMLAPNADIHLVQVLNNYGVGTLESVLEGLKYVYDKRMADRAKKKAERKTVLNCSFMLSIPLTKRQLKKPIRSDLETFFMDYTIHGDQHVLYDDDPARAHYVTLAPQQTLERWLVRPLIEVLNVIYNRIPVITSGEEILQLADASNMMIFAAAGNDGKHPKHPPASYPAAYRPIHGVGALDKSKTHKMAEYSNIADSPVTDGFLTFGGFPGKKGMLGLYIHSIYPTTGKANVNGWARWSGTSFATGVMSGLAAAALCKLSPSKVLKLFYNLLNQGFGKPHEVDVEQP